MWCFWLLGAWAVSWLIDTSVPRVRWMLFAGSLGLMLGWPAFRLSERVRPGSMLRGVAVVLFDWLAMIGVYQAVIWSLHLLAGWPLSRGLVLDAAIAGWSLLTGLIIAAARLWPGVAARWVGMVLCVALVLAEPVMVWASLASGGEAWSMRVSPVQALWVLTEPPSRGEDGSWNQHIMLICFIALSGWLALGAWSVIGKLTRGRPEEIPRG